MPGRTVRPLRSTTSVLVADERPDLVVTRRRRRSDCPLMATALRDGEAASTVMTLPFRSARSQHGEKLHVLASPRPSQTCCLPLCYISPEGRGWPTSIRKYDSAPLRRASGSPVGAVAAPVVSGGGRAPDALRGRSRCAYRAPTFAAMLWMCFLTVHSAMNRAWEISRLLPPAISRSRTSISRSVRAKRSFSGSSSACSRYRGLQRDQPARRLPLIEGHIARAHP